MTPYSDIDVYGEWVNAPAYPELVRILCSGVLGRYHDSCALIRAMRPESPREGQIFWDNPVHRAHLLNALLRRDGRTITQVETDLNLKDGKFYVFKDNWGLVFNPRPHKQVTVMTLDGDFYDADVLKHLPGGYAMLQLSGYPDTVKGRWSPANKAYRLLGPLSGPVGQVSFTGASRVTELSEPTLAGTLAALGLRATSKVHLSALARLEPPTGWLERAWGLMIGELGDEVEPFAPPPRLNDTLNEYGVLAHLPLLAGAKPGGVDHRGLRWESVGLLHPDGSLSRKGETVLDALWQIAEPLGATVGRRGTLTRALTALELPERLPNLLALQAGPRTWITELMFPDDPNGPRQRVLQPTLAEHPPQWAEHKLVNARGLTVAGRDLLGGWRALATGFDAWL